MKKLKIMILLLVTVAISCNEEKQKTIQKENSFTANIKHYVCTNKCENSGGDTEGSCPVCKKAYVHNQAYHNKDFLLKGPLNISKNNQNTGVNTSAPSAQNSLGVYHYTCSNGCIGGAGTATKCAVCDATLVHNKAYHNN